jgi:hypothetical protein
MGEAKRRRDALLTRAQAEAEPLTAGGFVRVFGSSGRTEVFAFDGKDWHIQRGHTRSAVIWGKAMPGEVPDALWLSGKTPRIIPGAGGMNG